jgi:hypothetical protein
MNSVESFRELLCEQEGGVLTVDGESKHWDKLYLVGLVGYSEKRIMGKLVTAKSPSSGKGEVFYISGKAFNRWCVTPRGTKPENKHRWDCSVRGRSDESNPDNRLSFEVSDFPFYKKDDAVFTRLSLGKYRIFGDFRDFKEGKAFVGFNGEGEPLCFVPSYEWMQREYENIAFISDTDYGSDVCKRIILRYLRLAEDKEYQLEVARSKLTGSDCAVKEVSQDGVNVFRFNPTNNGVCKLLNDVDCLYVNGVDSLNGVKVVDTSSCRDLRQIEITMSPDCTFIAPSVSNGFKRISLMFCDIVGLSKVMFRHDLDSFGTFALQIKSCTGLDTLSVEATGYSGYDDRNAIRIEDKTLRVLAVNAPTLVLCARSFHLTTPRLQSLIVDAGALKISEFYKMLLDTPEVESISFKVSKMEVSKDDSGSIWLNLGALKKLKRLNLEVAEPCKEDIKLVLPDGCVATAKGVVCSVYKKVGEIGG